MKTLRTILLAYLTTALSTVIAADADQVFFSYSHEGEFKSDRKVEVSVRQSGQADVKIQKQTAAQITYQTKLSQLELESLDTLIRSTGDLAGKTWT